jgi:uncharacterized Zn-binding protein involved in type VI secretion
MNRSICCEGDATSHGGEVTKVSGSMNVYGRHNARLGDSVSCPEHGDNQITEAGIMLDKGIPVVLRLCRTACGSTIIASAKMTVSE